LAASKSVRGWRGSTKRALASTISARIKHRGLTQAHAAAVAGIGQPKISALMNGNVAGFSLERLIELVTQLGGAVTIVITRRRAAGKLRRVTVREARHHATQ